MPESTFQCSACSTWHPIEMLGKPCPTLVTQKLPEPPMHPDAITDRIISHLCNKSGIFKDWWREIIEPGERADYRREISRIIRE